MAVISFDRVNRYVIVGYLTNQFDQEHAEASGLTNIHSHGGYLYLTNDAYTDPHAHTPLARIWYPTAYGDKIEQSDTLTVIPGETYTLSYYVKAHGRYSAIYQAEIEWYDAALQLLGSDFSSAVDINDLGWVRFTFTVTVPPGATRAITEMYARSTDISNPHQFFSGPVDDTTAGLPPDIAEELMSEFTDYIIFDAAQFELGSVATDWHSPDDTDTSVTIQELYDAIIDFQDNSINLNMEQICAAEGKADLGGGRLTVVTLKMLNGWKVKFTDRFNEPTTLCTIEDGNFVGDGYFPLESSEFVFSTISQATTGALVPGSGLTTEDVLDLENVEQGLTVRNALRLIAAAVAGELSGAEGNTIVIRNAVADSKDRITATVDNDGNRTDIDYDLTD